MVLMYVYTAIGIMSFMMHEIVYFGRSLPWMVIDATPYFRKYKLQPVIAHHLSSSPAPLSYPLLPIRSSSLHAILLYLSLFSLTLYSTTNTSQSKIPTAREQWECTKRVLLLHFTVELPQIWQFHPLCRAVGLSTTTPFPTFTTMFLQIALFFVLEDTWHYWAHRAFHWGPLYRYVHKIHHTYSAPFGLAAEYASPIEVLSLGLGTIGPPLLWCALTGDLHLVTMYTWTFLRLLQAVDSHSGYDFPWSLNKFLPIWAGAEHHDVHHEKFVGNYASSFRWWDYFMDTEAGPEAAKRRRERKMKKEAEAMAKAKTQ